MKKLFITASVIGSLMSSTAIAKTEGSYFGIDIIQSKSSFDSSQRNGKSSSNIYKIQEDSKASIGVNYKYAFNFDGFFIAPGAFFDYSNLSMNDSSNDTWKINSRLGAKLDLGYDITDKLAVSVNTALVSNQYEVDWPSVSAYKKDSDISLAYGLGAKYSILDNLDINLGYEVSTVEMESSIINVAETTKFDLKTIRVGTSFKF